MGSCKRCEKCSRVNRLPQKKLKGGCGTHKKVQCRNGNAPNYLHGKDKQNTQMIYPRSVSMRH